MALLTSKLCMPALAGTLPRDRLTSLLREFQHRRLVVVTAGAGYGKTTLAAAALSGIRDRVIWYRLDGQDRDLGTFTAYLSAGLNALSGKAGGRREGAGKAPMGGAVPPEARLNQLMEILSGAPESGQYLVLDDFHAVEDSPEVCRAVERLLALLHERIRVIILSRRPPALKLSRLRAGGRLLEIDETDLAFTRKEIRDYYTRMNRFAVADADIADLHEKTGGWAASLVLFKYALKHAAKDNIRSHLSRFNGSQEHIFAYLEENFFDAQPRITREFLIKANLLAEIDSERCDRIFGLGNSRERLSELVKEHLLVFPDRENSTIFHFHHLFRDFLSVKAARVFSKGQIRGFHRDIAADMKTDLPFRAIEHSLLAADYETAARMMEANEMRFLLEGSILFLSQCFEKIPETVLTERHSLLFLKAKLLAYHGKPNEAMDCLKTAILRIRTQDRKRSGTWVEDELKYMVDLGSLYYCTGHVREARDLMEQVREKIDPQSTTYVIIFTYLIFLSSVLGEFKRAAGYLKEAKSTAMTFAEFERRVALVLFRTSEAYFHYIRGEFGLAGEVNRKLLASALAVGAESCLPLAYYQDAATRAMETDYTGGLAASDRGIRVCEDMALNDSKKAWIYLAGADNCMGLGRPEEARERIDRAAALFEASGNRWGLAHAWEVSARLSLAEDRIHAAAAFMDDAFDLIRGYGLGLTRAIFENTMARTFIRDGRWTRALECLDTARPGFSETAYYRFENHLLTARALGETNRPGKAAHHLREGLAICDANGYHRLFDREEPLVRPLGKPAKRGCSAGQARSGPGPLAVSLTGRFGIRINDADLDLSRCPSTPALTIFKYMAACPGAGFISREIFIEMIWPEQDPGRTAKRFNMAMSSLRRLLQPDLAPRAPSAYILRKKDTYCLARENPGVTTDIGRFEALLATAVETEDPDAARAVRIRAEQSLAGDFLAEDPYLEWATPIRERLTSLRLDNLRAVADRYATVLDHENALTYCRKILEIDPCDEAAYAALMNLYHAMGRISRVSETWNLYRQAAESLGVPVDPGMAKQYQDLTRP